MSKYFIHVNFIDGMGNYFIKFETSKVNAGATFKLICEK